MMTQLQSRIDRVRHALGATRSEHIEDMKVVYLKNSNSILFSLDFNQGRDAADLEQKVYSLIAEVASIKDHLKKWCREHHKPFMGEELINSNREVALVHDIWNTDKHAELNRSPRSGFRPSIRALQQELKLETGTIAGSCTVFSLDPITGSPIVQTTGDDSAALVIDAQIIDEKGNEIGSLQDVCAKAIEAWTMALIDAGVSIT